MQKNEREERQVEEQRNEEEEEQRSEDEEEPRDGDMDEREEEEVEGRDRDEDELLIHGNELKFMSVKEIDDLLRNNKYKVIEFARKHHNNGFQ